MCGVVWWCGGVVVVCVVVVYSKIKKCEDSEAKDNSGNGN